MVLVRLEGQRHEVARQPGGFERREDRADGAVLPPQLDMGEAISQETLELVRVQLPDVKRVVLVEARRDVTIRCRRDEQAVRRKHSGHAVEKASLLRYVLDCLETDHHVEGAGREGGEIEHVSLDEREIGELVRVAAVADAGRVDLESDDFSRLGGQHRRPVALATRKIENSPAGHLRCREEVSVIVLVHDLEVIGPGNAPLSGPLDGTTTGPIPVGRHHAPSLYSLPFSSDIAPWARACSSSRLHPRRFESLNDDSYPTAAPFRSCRPASALMRSWNLAARWTKPWYMPTSVCRCRKRRDSDS
jgi:hypothetical protein